jgi:hypothetical protein
VLGTKLRRVAPEKLGHRHDTIVILLAQKQSRDGWRQGSKYP